MSPTGVTQLPSPCACTSPMNGEMCAGALSKNAINRKLKCDLQRDGKIARPRRVMRKCPGVLVLVLARLDQAQAVQGSLQAPRKTSDVRAEHAP
jgi:hypothetical protein